MKLLLDNSVKPYRLNANEACIYACIAKCTRAGKGWYGNYAALADAMPFVMSYKTAGRAIAKLLTLGIIEMREEKLFTRGQNVQTDGQIVPTDGQIVPSDRQIVPQNRQIVLPPITPINNKNINEIKEEKQQPRALHAHDGARQQDCLFEKFWRYFSVNMPDEFQNRKNAAHIMFAERSKVAQRAIVEAAQEGAPGHPGDNQNPYFFVADFPEPQPAFLTGIEQDNARAAGHTLVQVLHNGKYCICTQEVAKEFGLQIMRNW